MGNVNTGVVISDEHGLCLLCMCVCCHAMHVAKGSLNSMTSGFAHAILKNASKLAPSEKPPVVLIVTDMKHGCCFELSSLQSCDNCSRRKSNARSIKASTIMNNDNNY